MRLGSRDPRARWAVPEIQDCRVSLDSPDRAERQEPLAYKARQDSECQGRPVRPVVLDLQVLLVNRVHREPREPPARLDLRATQVNVHNTSCLIAANSYFIAAFIIFYCINVTLVYAFLIW